MNRGFDFVAAHFSALSVLWQNCHSPRDAAAVVIKSAPEFPPSP